MSSEYVHDVLLRISLDIDVIELAAEKKKRGKKKEKRTIKS
jgi:hypothetical protein